MQAASYIDNCRYTHLRLLNDCGKMVPVHCKAVKTVCCNRVDKVIDVSDRKLPQYITTKEKLADVATRGLKLKRDKELLFWLKTPFAFTTIKRGLG